MFFSASAQRAYQLFCNHDFPRKKRRSRTPLGKIIPRFNIIAEKKDVPSLPDTKRRRKLNKSRSSRFSSSLSRNHLPPSMSTDTKTKNIAETRVTPHQPRALLREIETARSLFLSHRRKKNQKAKAKQERAEE